MVVLELLALPLGREAGDARGVAVSSEETELDDNDDGISVSAERAERFKGTTVCVDVVDREDEDEDEDGAGELERGDEMVELGVGKVGSAGLKGRREAIA